MNQLRTLILTTLSLLSIGLYAESRFNYRHEYENRLATSQDGEIALLPSENLLQLNAFIDYACIVQNINKPSIFIQNRVLPEGLSFTPNNRRSSTRGASFVIEKNFLLRSSDEEIEAFITSSLNILHQ